jgi:S-formylglutathione hydrolase FrmB
VRQGLVRRLLPRRARRGTAGVIAAALLAVCVGGWTASAATTSVTTGVVLGGTARTDDGSYPVAETVVSPGVVLVDVWSAAFQGPVRIELVLPADWSADPQRTWPTLYTLMGFTGPTEDFAGGGWLNNTRLAGFMSSRDVLTVIPDDDHGGAYANWTGPSFSRGLTHPQFETFDAVELPQILTRDYRSSGRNAVLGDSLGGAGAMYLAAMHPGLFQAAASMSGLLDLQDPASWPVIVGGEARVGENPWGPFGDPTLNAGVWAAHNPTALVNRLRGMRLFVSAGNGLPGPLDNAIHLDGTAFELIVELQTARFVADASKVGIPVTADFYGPGIHNWPYWDREIPVAWRVLALGLGLPQT